jgi:aryl-alcohol dehydrogenase-like predicted oxidoreductase
MRDVIRSGGFDTIQTPYHLLNPSAGEVMPASFAETNFGNIIADCAALDMGVLAIRVFAGGALLGREPSAHTLTTPFFPLALYERDRQRAAAISGDNESLKERALRFVLDDQRIAGAIIGFGAAAEVDDLAALAERLTR